MFTWLRKNHCRLIMYSAIVGFMIFIYSCEPKVTSLEDSKRLVTRGELQLELNHIIDRAEYKILSLDRQETLQRIVFQNALVLVQGQPLNPVGLITGIAALYGVTQAGGKVTKTVKNGIKKRKESNGNS